MNNEIKYWFKLTNSMTNWYPMGKNESKVRVLGVVSVLDA